MSKTEDDFTAHPPLTLPESDLSGEQRLKMAIRQAKTAQADRLDSISDIKETDIVRLELLLQDLQPVFDAVPEEDERWDFCINKGMQPRLWLDASAFIMIAHNRRDYRFVRDTRVGRVILSENKDIKTISDAVTRYIASRILERERLLDDLSPQSTEPGDQSQKVCGITDQKVVLAEPAGSTLLVKFLWFAGGALLGCLVLILALRFYGVTLPLLPEVAQH